MEGEEKKMRMTRRHRIKTAGSPHQNWLALKKGKFRSRFQFSSCTSSNPHVIRRGLACRPITVPCPQSFAFFEMHHVSRDKELGKLSFFKSIRYLAKRLARSVINESLVSGIGMEYLDSQSSASVSPASAVLKLN